MKIVPEITDTRIIDELVKNRNSFIKNNLPGCDPRMREIINYFYMYRLGDIVTMACCQGHSAAQNIKKHGKDYNMVSLPYIMFIANDRGFANLIRISERMINKSIFTYQTELHIVGICTDVPGVTRAQTSHPAVKLICNSNRIRDFKLWCEKLEETVFEVLS